MMFPIWKDACSPVQPLRTVILDLHGTAIAVDLDMSSLLNYMSGGGPQTWTSKSCWTRRLRCQVCSARGRGVLSLHGSTMAHTPQHIPTTTSHARETMLAYGKVGDTHSDTPKTNRCPLVVACREALTNTHLFTFALWARTLLRVSSSSVCLGP